MLTGSQGFKFLQRCYVQTFIQEGGALGISNNLFDEIFGDKTSSSLTISKMISHSLGIMAEDIYCAQWPSSGQRLYLKSSKISICFQCFTLVDVE